MKEGGQRKSSGAPRRARCALCHSCCSKGCLNPQCLAQPILPSPHADQLLGASVWEALGGPGEQVSGKAQAPGPLHAALPTEALLTPHHPDQTPRQARRQVRGQVPGESRHRARPV